MIFSGSCFFIISFTLPLPHAACRIVLGTAPLNCLSLDFVAVGIRIVPLSSNDRPNNQQPNNQPRKCGNNHFNTCFSSHIECLSSLLLLAGCRICQPG